MSKKYLRWSDLSADEQASIGNGCGPSWCPDWIRNQLFSWFFLASCNHHDFGYMVGGNEFRRWVCDWKFFGAMIRDSFAGQWYFTLLKLVLSIIFYLCVLIGGWLSFRYGTPIASKDAFLQGLG